MAAPQALRKKRKSGIPTGNAGEYFVMGELLRRGYDAQIADRNTQGYDLLVGRAGEDRLQKVQVKTVRVQPWFIRVSDFVERPNQPTVYVLLGSETSMSPVRFFVAVNREVAACFHHPKEWKADNKDSGFMKLDALKPYEGNWAALFPQAPD